jgi:hypothetical protein
MVNLTTTQVETLFGELEYIELRLKILSAVEVHSVMMRAVDRDRQCLISSIVQLTQPICLRRTLMIKNEDGHTERHTARIKGILKVKRGVPLTIRLLLKR